VIIDSSALLAVVLAEPDAARYARAISQSRSRRLPAVTWFEASMRIDAKGDAYAANRFDDFVTEFGIEVVTFTPEHAREARRARQLFGKPHPAQLNYGDCMVYGVARHEREALLFKGEDFRKTDIEAVLKD
jgi:ribonuclease VapC